MSLEAIRPNAPASCLVQSRIAGIRFDGSIGVIGSLAVLAESCIEEFTARLPHLDEGDVS